jgi:hypothetical protein
MRIAESKFIEPDKLTFADAQAGDVFVWKQRPALGYHMKVMEPGSDLGLAGGKHWCVDLRTGRLHTADEGALVLIVPHQLNVRDPSL